MLFSHILDVAIVPDPSTYLKIILSISHPYHSCSIRYPTEYTSTSYWQFMPSPQDEAPHIRESYKGACILGTILRIRCLGVFRMRGKCFMRPLQKECAFGICLGRRSPADRCEGSCQLLLALDCRGLPELPMLGSHIPQRAMVSCTVYLQHASNIHLKIAEAYVRSLSLNSFSSARQM